MQNQQYTQNIPNQSLQNYTQSDPAQQNLPHKKHSKIIIPLIICGVILLIIAGGSVVYINANSKPKIVVPKKVSLAFWGLTDDVSTVQPILDKYHELNPNITVNYEKRSATNYKENLSSRFATGASENLPDVVEIDSKWTTEFSNYLSSPLEATYSVGDFNNNYFAAAQKDLQVFNLTAGSLQIVGLPLETDSLALCYNKNLIPDPNVIPTTWPEFKNFALSLTVRSQTDGNTTPKITRAGLSIGNAVNVTYSADILQMLLMQNRVTFPDYANDSTAFNNPQNMADAINFYKSFSNNSDDKNNTWSANLKGSFTEFENGNAAMIFCYAHDINTLQTLNSNLNFGVTVPPVVAGQTYLSGQANAIAVPNLKGNQLEAWNFTKYYTSPDSLKILVDSEKTNKKVFPSKEQVKTLDKNVLYGAFAKMAPTSYSWKTPKLESTQKFFQDIALSSLNYSADSATNLISDFYKLYGDTSTQ